MNSDPIAELNVNSSQLEREWLAQIQNAVPDVFLIEPALTETPPLAVVSVPDFLFDQFSQDENQPGQATKSTQRCSSDRNQGDSRATPNRGEPKHDGLGPRQLDGRSATPIARMHAANDCHGTEAVARQISLGVTNQVVGLPMATPISSDLREKPSDWSSSTTEKDKEERNKTNASNDPEPVESVASTNVDNKSIAQLTDQILSRFPLTYPTILLFAGSEWNPHVDETCAQVAYQLASRNVGKVLLVDSEFEKSKLTNATGTSAQPGMAEIFNRKIGLDGCIADHDEANMDFLPVGKEPVWHWRIAEEKIRSLVTRFKSRYQFVCISVGDAHGPAARIWAADSEGVYLVVSMTNSSQTVAKSAVDQLHTNGARLLGCIASDVV